MMCSFSQDILRCIKVFLPTLLLQGSWFVDLPVHRLPQKKTSRLKLMKRMPCLRWLEKNVKHLTNDALVVICQVRKKVNKNHQLNKSKMPVLLMFCTPSWIAASPAKHSCFRFSVDQGQGQDSWHHKDPWGREETLYLRWRCMNDGYFCY